ncbi:MAG: L,D-transpeptidase family protein [Pseudomonadota bacterium]
MERWRWLPRQPETAHVRVNIAAGRLEVVESDTPRLAMRAIVGRTYRQTPSLAGRIDLVTINPAWTVPHTIAVEDLLPQQRQDPTFLQRNRIRIYSARDGREVDWRNIDWASLQPEHFGYTLRQDAGPDNSLGSLKFSFDNPYDIYLHGTPTPVLFRLPERTFSSGCVRIEHPDLLAEYLLLPEQHMDRAAIQAAIDRGQTRAIALEHALPVYLIYMNVWTDAAGSAHFEGDPYGRDRRLLAAWQRARMHPSR